jgi:hypothetical protein
VTTPVADRPLKRAASAAAIGLLVLAAGFGSYALVPPAGARSMREFDPARVATLELRMWQAYYAKERVRLFALLVTLLREQYHYSWALATREGFHLARAAARFGDLRSGYDVVLPDLEAGYAEAKSWMNAGYDAQAVAHAELAWWVARRVPGQNSPEMVGALMADEYAMLYEAPRGAVSRAALLRAEAAALRDEQARNPDWPEIERLLLDSYESLFDALHERSVRSAVRFAPV